MFFKNHGLKFQSHPGGIKVECYAKFNIPSQYDKCVCVCVCVCVRVHVRTCVCAHVEWRWHTKRQKYVIAMCGLLAGTSESSGKVQGSSGCDVHLWSKVNKTTC